MTPDGRGSLKVTSIISNGYNLKYDSHIIRHQRYSVPYVHWLIQDALRLDMVVMAVYVSPNKQIKKKWFKKNKKIGQCLKHKSKNLNEK